MTHRRPNRNEDERQPFQSVDWPGGVSWRQLVTSSAAHLLAALALGLISALLIPVIQDPDQTIEISFLSDPPLEAETLPPEPEPPAPKAFVPPKPVPVPPPDAEAPVIPPLEIVEAPKPERPQPVVPPKPRVEVVHAGFDAPKPAPPASPKREIRTDLFARESAASPDTEAPARKVQTGGFGDPEGMVAAETTRARGARASLGAFDLPAGPGHGNGSGGAQGSRGTVASAGFGDRAAASGAGTARAARGAVRQAGFTETTAPAEPPRPRAKVTDAATFPVEIVSKPKPAYTEEARKKHLEGEVVLEVLFSASGRTQVVRIVSGLGSGLDESAVRAAEKILFKPARRDGQLVDYTAVVRILFQLT